ncbi:hypothetical protein HYU22_05730 [Candidatus Woesearchaeota archaeon]|nr:hypothetical protein [Candidatus Woesearchaeota archaeon]
MQKTIEVLVGKAHKYMQQMASFRAGQYGRNQNLIAKALELGGGFHPEVRRDLAVMDHDTTEVPFLVAGRLLDNTLYGPQEIQEMLDKVGEFTKYGSKTFCNYGTFLSVMIARTLNESDEMMLYTRNDAIVHVPDFYVSLDKETSYPWKMENSDIYEQDNLLIAHLGSRLKHGRLVVLGNVGKFFAYQNSGADVQLDGECGWRSCYEVSDGRVTINGTAGHALGEYARGGKIFVNGKIRSIGSYYTEAYGHEIFNNGKLVPKEKLEPLPFANGMN